MGWKTVTVNIDIDDIIDEIDDDVLVDELNRRGYNIKQKKIRTSLHNLDDYEYPDFKTKEELLLFIKGVLGSRSWHDKNRVLDEINDLLE